MARSAEAILKEVDWERVREGLRRHRRRERATTGSLAVFFALLYAVTVALPMRPVSRAEMALRNLPIIGGAFVVYALAMAAYLRHLARLADPIEMLALFRRRLRSERRWNRRLLWVYPGGIALVTAINVLRPDPVRVPGSVAIGVLLLGTWAYDALVRIPRMEREWADLERRD